MRYRIGEQAGVRYWMDGWSSGLMEGRPDGFLYYSYVDIRHEIFFKHGVQLAWVGGTDRTGSKSRWRVERPQNSWRE